MEARCFRAYRCSHLARVVTVVDHDALLLERDSPRDQLVVTLFLLTVFGLLLGVGIKGKMEKAGLEPRFNWATGRELWEVHEAFDWLMVGADFVDCVGSHTARSFGRIWAWDAESVRSSRRWSIGRVRPSVGIACAVILYFV